MARTTTHYVLIGLCLTSSPIGMAAAYAQAAAPSEQLAADEADRSSEDILVTAQLRSERLQDVPASISALNGELLSQRAIVSIDQLTAIVPGVRMSSYGNPNFVFIRGVGAGNNLATEQPIGTFVDGVYIGRDRAAKSQLFDLERVEILKGPQVTLFGKNTTGGAFSIVTRSPGKEFEGYVQGNYEFALESEGVEGAVTIPFADTFRVRIGGRYQNNMRWVKNAGTGVAAGAPEQLTGRIVIVAEPSDRFDIKVKAEAGSLRGGLDPLELIRATPAFLATVRAIDPSEDGTLNRHATGPGLIPGFDQAFNNVDTQNYLATMNWQLGGVTLTSITGYVRYKVGASGDVDSTALSFIKNDSRQRYQSFSQELRLLSSDEGPFKYVGGLYFANENYVVSKAVSINLAGHPTVNAAVPAVFPRLVTRNQLFDQNAKTLSPYAQGSLALSDAWSITLGLRYAHSHKTVRHQDLFFSVFGQSTPNPLYNALFPNLGLGNVHSFSGIERKEGALSGLGRIEFRPEKGSLFYASFTRGRKAGGFDEDNARGLPRANEFDPETISSFQGGMKKDIGRGALNVDLFYNTISKLQVASFDGVAAFQVTNAASAVSRGVDIEFRQKLTDRLGLSLQGGYLDAYYKRYPGAPGISPAPTQDLSGKPLPFAPKWTGNLSLSHELPLSGSWSLKTQGDLFYSSAFNATFNNDPALTQHNYAKVDLRLALYNSRADLEVSLVGRNLTNSTAISFGNPLPLAPLIGVNYFAYSDPPRTIALQIRKGF